MVKRMALGEIICEDVVEDVSLFLLFFILFSPRNTFRLFREDICVFETTKKMGEKVNEITFID